MESAQNAVDNPNTAIESENEKSATVKRKKRHKTNKLEPISKIPGVHKIVLSDLTQEYLGCVVGESVTAERPWMRIDKDLIQEHLERYTESSVFLPAKEDVLASSKSEVLLGYIPDESKDYDEFYVCARAEAMESVEKMVRRLRQMNEERLQNAVNRKARAWNSLGSEAEVEESMSRRHRALIEVEIESKYPCLPFKIRFKANRSQDLRDGYMELRPVDGALSTIFRRRVDAFVQVAPDVVSNEAQTVCTYPKNSFTQYEYEIPEISFDTQSFKDYMTDNLDLLCDILKVNGCIDLYLNDYEKLAIEDKFGIKVMVPIFKEYSCFIDLNLSGGKMISSAEWHPMWSGCIVCAYVDIAPTLYITSKPATDEVLKAVHDTHPVLFWSLNDNLKPKLILETPRPVHILSCCPYDPNLILGGLANGQIILWDINDKLQSVEQQEILTVEQQKYREYMFSMMNWMKNIFDLGHVRPAALSDFKYAHKGCVKAISWMSPFHRFTNTGNVEEVEEGAPNSLQFISAGEAGVIYIWDLLKKPARTPGAFKGFRRVKRLNKRPSALLVMESPFKSLHLNLRPIYQINLVSPVTNKMLPIGTCQAKFHRSQYLPAAQPSRKSLKLSDRIIYTPLLNRQDTILNRKFYVGALTGDFIQGTWEGQDFDSGEVVNWEKAQFIQSGKCHDGPIIAIDYSPANDTVLTVGGKVFALWRESHKDRPLLWRKGSSIYTYGAWFYFEKASIRLIRIDGYREIWTLFYQSKTPLDVFLLSNGPINISVPHPRKLKYNLVGLSDYRGSLLLYYARHSNPLVLKAKEEYMSEFLTKEVERKKIFLEWQKKWTERYASEVHTAEEKKEGITRESTEFRAKRGDKMKVVKISPGMRYLETVQQQHLLHEQTRIKSIILTKKQLNTEDLLKQREPLRKLEEEQEVKRRKQRNKLKESGRIFKDQVAMLFPDVIKKKPPVPINPYEDCYGDDAKREKFQEYGSISSNAKSYIDENPFRYDFRWGTVLKLGHERKRKLEEASGKYNHRARYAVVKQKKVQESDATKAAEDAKAASAEEYSATTTKSSINEY